MNTPHIKHFTAFFLLLALTAFSLDALAEDLYEENDSLATAYPHQANEGLWLSNPLLPGLGQSWDVDWYQIEVTPGYNRVLVDLQFSNASNDLELYLVDSAGFDIASSTTSTDNEYITFDVDPAGGTYYIRVETYTGSGALYNGTSYDLWWDGIDPIIWNLDDDNYEENNTRATAYDHRLNETYLLSSLLGPGKAYDFDWYQIEVTTGYTQVQIELQHTHSEGDLGVELFDASGNSIIFSNTTTDNESIHYDVGVGGTYYILVYTNDSYTGQTYDLWWDDVLPSPGSDDAYEPNNNISTAYPHSLNNQVWLSDLLGPGISNEFDVYQISVSSGVTRIIADLSFSHAEGDLGLELWDASGNTLVFSNSADDDEHIDYDVGIAGSYYLLVYNNVGYTGQTYDMWWNAISTSTGTTGSDDAYEENDSPQTAYAHGGNEQIPLSNLFGSGISNDEDWYQIQVSPGQTRVQIDLTFTHGTNSDLDLYLYNATGNTILASSFTSTDNEFIDFDVTTAGTYLILVDTWRGGGDVYAGASYDLVWDDIEAGAGTTTTTGNTKAIFSGGDGDGGGGGSMSLISLLFISMLALLRRRHPLPDKA